MKGGCLKGLIKTKKGGCKVGKKRAGKKRVSKTHRMPDGTLMTGATHSPSSRPVPKKKKLRPGAASATPRKGKGY